MSNACGEHSGRQGMSTPLMAALLALAPLPAQEGKQGVAAAAERWVTSDQVDPALLEATVKAMMVDAALGIDWLATNLKVAATATGEPRSKGVRGLAIHCVLEFGKQQRRSGVVFVGQYAPLAPLLLETPDWYPHDMRVHLVPMLRDLQPTLPDLGRVEGVVRLVEDEREALGLRRRLAAMLWQWGKRDHAQRILDGLQRATGEGDGEDRVQTTLELADYLVLLREYKQAANAHRAAQVLARDTGVSLKPIAWYSAACVHALVGDVERGIAALTTCAELQASPHLDSSLRLERRLFDTDPEIALLRRDPRFADIVSKAFPAAKGQPGR